MSNVIITISFDIYGALIENKTCMSACSDLTMSLIGPTKQSLIALVTETGILSGIQVLYP